ncbi:MAG: zeta toxin family protein [Candidatus Gastranaerophilales bacterium]|nr:zeta toxin family protein [Elusimicrobiota bacterium]MBR6297997.1 zeta toxin family protein [Candidatus Gastranaerophilales bacterium]
MITVNEEDKKLFEQNGFTYEDVGNTINHYRQEGLSDDDIQLKINNRISEFKTKNIKDYGRFGYTEISAYKPPTVLQNLKNAWDFVTQVPVAAFMEQKQENEAAELRTKGMLQRAIGQDLTEEEKARIQELDNPYSVGKFNQANNYGIYSKFLKTSDDKYFNQGGADVIGERFVNGTKQLYADVMKQTAIMYSMIKDAGVLGGIGGAGGFVVGGIGGAVATKTPQGAVTGATQGAKTGASLFARTAVAKKSFELEAGFMRQELEQLNNDFVANGTEPLTDREIDNLSMSVGLVNAGLEYLGFSQIVKVLPNGKKILDKFGKEGIKELAKDQTFRSQFAALSMELAKAGISEGSTEMLQEYTNFVAGNIARKMRDVAPRPLADKMDEILNAGLVGAVSAILMGGVGTTAQVAAVKSKQGIDKLTAKKESEEMTIDERNEFLNENMNTLSEVATEEANEKINQLRAGISYTRIKDEMERQGANSEVADTSAQLVQKLDNVISDKFGEEGKELLRKTNLQILINQNNQTQVNDEEKFIDSTIKERQEQSFKPSELLTDAKTFQYKDNADENGVTDRMNGVEEFDPLYAGDIIVYETKDGKKYVVDGHQRLGLAKRLGGDNITLKGYLFKETDGYTPEQMRVLAAQKNIAENSGTALDTAKIIKEVGLENLPKTIPTNSAMVKDGIALSRLGDDAFQKVVNGEVTTAQGARIADIIRNDEAKQITAIDGVRIAKFANLDQVSMFAREVLAAETVKTEQTNLFGTQELFETTAIEKIQIVDKAVKSLKNDKKIFSGLLRNNSKISGRGKNRLDRITNEKIKQAADVAIELIEHLASKKGIISDKALQLASLVKKEEMTLDEAAKEFKAYMLTPEVVKELFGKVQKEISYNQAAISRYVNKEENPYKSLNELADNEEIEIRPDEFYSKGLYQGPRAEDVKNWRRLYPEIAADLDEQDRLKAEGKLPPTIEINTPERMQLRYDIVCDLYGEGAKKKEKQAYFVIGAPASGKSTLTDSLAEETGSLIIDSDDVKKFLPEFAENPKRADQVHKESQAIANDILDIAAQAGDNIILPIVGKSEKSIMKRYNTLKDAGYDVHLKLVYLPLEKTLQRANSRYKETGRLVPFDYIVNEVGYNPVQNYAILKEKGLFKTYEAVSSEVKYGEKPKQLEDAQIGQIVQSWQTANTQELRLQQTENIGPGLETRSVGRGAGNNEGLSFNQDEEAPRGKFRIDEDGTAIIDILKDGDPSTIVHELGHYYLYSLDTLAKGGNKRAQRELAEVNRIFGIKEGANLSYDEMVDFHERFARGFEAYLMEGSAPSKNLLRVFQNFKDWLRQVYNSVKDLDIDLSDDARKLYDRVFTTDEEYEREVLPKYQYNYVKCIELENAINKPMYKFKKGIYDLSHSISTWYDKLFVPLETRLGKISPELRDKLRNHTAQLALTTGKDLNAAADFIRKTEAMKQQNKSDYLMFDLALKNRDEHMVRILANKYGFTEEFNNIREILEEIYSEALEVGIDVGYLDNYFPRLVKHDMSEKFIEYIDALARQEQQDVINQVIKLEDAKISMVLKDLAEADNNKFWSVEDRAKFINNHIRGFGKNNILLSRNASLKFERRIDELDGDFNQFYETFEPALINYIGNSRKVIEARKFFGSEYKEVGKLRARIKRKKATLDEVKDRYPNVAKAKEITRLKYELSPIEIKLEELENRKDLLPEQIELRDKLRGQKERLQSQIEWTEGANAKQVQNTVIKRLNKEIRETSEEITNIIGKSENVEDSVGALINSLAAKGEIYAKDEKLIREMLVARFNASRVCEPIKMVKDLTYISTLNDFTNAITQFGDLAFSVYKYGFSNTFKGLKKPFDISMKDLGINDLAYEFADTSKISKWLKKQFEIIGLNAIDGLGKNAVIQASLLNAQKLAKSNNEEFIAKLKRIYGNNWEAAKNDLAEGRVTDDTIIFAFHELSDIQPISEDQVTELYQSGGGFMKLFYTLKTYGIKALDIARNDVTMNIQQGIMNKNKGQVVNGLKNLIRLQMLLWMFGVPIDALKDLLSNRDLNIFESMIDNLIPTFIINRFIIKDAGKSGLGSAIVNFFTPSVAPVTTRVLSGKKSAIAHIPIIGKPLYNWFLKDK